MNDFIDRLPVKVAALAGLVVGAISLYRGTSFTGSVERVIMAMVAFGLIASVLRALMQHSASEQRRPVEHRGRHLDASTPGMTAEDLNQRD